MVIFLVLGMTSDFQCYARYLISCVRRHWAAFNGLQQAVTLFADAGSGSDESSRLGLPWCDTGLFGLPRVTVAPTGSGWCCLGRHSPEWGCSVCLVRRELQACGDKETPWAGPLVAVGSSCHWACGGDSFDKTTGFPGISWQERGVEGLPQTRNYKCLSKSKNECSTHRSCSPSFPSLINEVTLLVSTGKHGAFQLSMQPAHDSGISRHFSSVQHS